MPEPSIDAVHEIMVVGAGAMGGQIAMVCALPGYQTTAYDPAEDALRRAEAELRGRLDGSVRKGRLTADEVERASPGSPSPPTSTPPRPAPTS
jgi:3-hydroxybutyryl-CoA dehydrogenase